MNTNILLIGLSIVLLALFLNQERSSINFKKEFAEWQSLYMKFYDTKQEQTYRLKIFAKNKQFVEKFEGHIVGLNKFADLDTKEFETLHLGLSQPTFSELGQEKSFDPLNYGSIPTVDVTTKSWYNSTFNSPVLDQGICGSCWAFSAIENLGFIWAQALDVSNPRFSEQELIDCSTEFNNKGCNGGWYYWAWNYTSFHGITTNQAYPYTSGSQGNAKNCPSNMYNSQLHPRYYPNSGLNYQTLVGRNDSVQFNAALNQQVLSVAIQANSPGIQFYQGGVVTTDCGIQVNHAVLAVGYTKDYVIIQNSWGTSWGLGGFAYLAYDRNEGAGACGFLQYPATANYLSQ